MYRKILVPIDGSKSSKYAFLKALELSKAFNAELHVLTVIPADVSYDIGPDTFLMDRKTLVSLQNIREQQAESLLNKVREEYAQDYPMVLSQEAGVPATKIVEYAQTHDIALIVIGNRGQGAFSRTFLGSVSNKVLHSFDKSVLVVKDPDN